MNIPPSHGPLPSVHSPLRKHSSNCSDATTNHSPLYFLPLTAPCLLNQGRARRLREDAALVRGNHVLDVDESILAAMHFKHLQRLADQLTLPYGYMDICIRYLKKVKYMLNRTKYISNFFPKTK